MIDEKIKAEAEKRYPLLSYKDGMEEKSREAIDNLNLITRSEKLHFLKGAHFGKEMRGSDITCPFCNEDGFDKLGLKIHLFNHCEEYRK